MNASSQIYSRSDISGPSPVSPLDTCYPRDPVVIGDFDAHFRCYINFALSNFLIHQPQVPFSRTVLPFIYNAT